MKMSKIINFLEAAQQFLGLEGEVVQHIGDDIPVVNASIHISRLLVALLKTLEHEKDGQLVRKYLQLDSSVNLMREIKRVYNKNLDFAAICKQIQGSVETIAYEMLERILIERTTKEEKDTQTLKENGVIATQTLKENGVIAFHVGYDTGSVRNELEQMKRSQVSHNDRKFEHVPLGESLHLLKRHDESLFKHILEVMKEYFGNEEFYCVSNLIICPHKTSIQNIQKLHPDHMFGPFKELVLAIDFSGKNQQLNTRYITGSHRFPEAYYDGLVTRTNNNFKGNFGSSRDEPGMPCNTHRLFDILIGAAIYGASNLSYTEVKSNAMIFDAGGLHSGNPVQIPEGDKCWRMFWTFRTGQCIHDYAEAVNAEKQADTWFEQGKIDPMTILNAKTKKPKRRLRQK